MAAFAVSAAGAGLGGMLANKMTGSEKGNGVSDLISQMNQILGTAQDNAIDSSTKYTNQAIGQQANYLNYANNALNSANTAANATLSNNVNLGTKQNQAINAPQLSAGYQALDAYMGTLGLGTPQGGSQSLSQNLQNYALLGPGLQNLQAAAAANNNSNMYAAPTSPTAPTVSPQDVQSYISQNLLPTQAYGKTIYGYTGAGGLNGEKASFGNSNSFLTKADAMNAAQVQQSAQQYLTQQAQQSPAYQQQLQQYQNQQQAYNNMGSLFQQSGLTPQGLAQATAYNSGNIGGQR